MPYFQQVSQELIGKVVYWGAEGAGKTKHLQWLQAQAPDGACGKLLQLATETERTSFFEFLPLTLGEVGGVATRLHLYSVPGQRAYSSARRDILRGCDGVVFVADARPERQQDNVFALRELQGALAAQGHNFADFPLVVSCTFTQDLGALSPRTLRDTLFTAAQSATVRVEVQGAAGAAVHQVGRAHPEGPDAGGAVMAGPTVAKARHNVTNDVDYATPEGTYCVAADGRGVESALFAVAQKLLTAFVATTRVDVAP